MTKKSVYDAPQFFELYQKLRENPLSLNEVVEKPTMLSLLPDLTNKKLLDLGCGTGSHLLLYLQRHARFVVGIDLSHNMLKQAEHDLSKHFQNGPHFALHPLSMEQLADLPESNFDVITSSFAFHYVQDFAKLLQDIRQKLPQWLSDFLARTSDRHLLSRRGSLGKRSTQTPSSISVELLS